MWLVRRRGNWRPSAVNRVLAECHLAGYSSTFSSSWVARWESVPADGHGDDEGPRPRRRPKRGAPPAIGAAAIFASPPFMLIYDLLATMVAASASGAARAFSSDLLWCQRANIAQLVVAAFAVVLMLRCPSRVRGKCVANLGVAVCAVASAVEYHLALNATSVGDAEVYMQRGDWAAETSGYFALLSSVLTVINVVDGVVSGARFGKQISFWQDFGGDGRRGRFGSEPDRPFEGRVVVDLLTMQPMLLPPPRNPLPRRYRPTAADDSDDDSDVANGRASGGGVDAFPTAIEAPRSRPTPFSWYD
jgi:hypothetical protein